MLLVRVEIGTGIFDPDKMIQCQSQVPTSSGPVGLSTGQATLVSCNRILNFLKSDWIIISITLGNGCFRLIAWFA
jgi:hypothetical protein